MGKRGEKLAARYLRRQGLKVVARRAKLPLGELDIVALDGPIVVFVEVKTRSSDLAGRPEEAVDASKQAKLTQLAQQFLRRHELEEYSCRFDVVAVTWPADGRRPSVRHFPSAFESHV